MNEEVDPSFTDVWGLCLPEIEGEEIPGVLSSDHRWKGEWEHVVIQEAIHYWPHHVCENILSDEVNGVFDDDDTKVDKLMHDKGSDRIIMIKIGLSEVNICAIDNWVKVTVLIQDKVSFKVDLEILED